VRGFLPRPHKAIKKSPCDHLRPLLVQEHCFYSLEAPVVRVTGWDMPYPHAQEWDYFPGPARVGRALQDVMEG
jgi:pyruvate/2-oxoglutarate/acetoin dehydrogenase E1 component